MSLSVSRTAVVASAMAFLTLAGSVNAQTVAGRGPILQTNAEGRIVCRELASYGQPYWEAKVRGRTNHDYAGLSNRFVVKTCFESRGACSGFIDRIHHRIMGIEQIYYARCTLR